jgi:hypothetical protein
MILYKTTALYPVGAMLGIDSRSEKQKRIPYIFEKLAEVPNMKEPTFVFAHMQLPHPPYVFDRDGTFVTRGEVAKRDNKTNYVNQLMFTNGKMKELIDLLLSRSEVPPIIVVQADEGPYPPGFRLMHATDGELQMKYGILNAYYLPGAEQNVLYPSITPVNTFRIIFNIYFNTDFELLPDKRY